MKLKNKQALQRLLSDPSRWTQHCLARDARGVAVDPVDESATCWCLIGAFDRLDISSDDYVELSILVYQKHRASVSVFNDHESTTHQKIMALLDEIPVNP